MTAKKRKYRLKKQAINMFFKRIAYEQKTIGRFWAKVDKTSSCWIWCGHLLNNGYGQHYIHSSSIMAHRYAYELTKGEISKGLVVHHICNNKSCVNPEHLELITQSENVKKGIGNKTHCKNGHELNEKNLSITTHIITTRRCKRCSWEWQKKKRDTNTIQVKQ